MSDIDVIFCRNLLAQIKPDVVKAGYRIVKDAWVYKTGRDQWEFHGPNQYYWYGSAGNAFDARYKGWCAFLKLD